jgi:hypothetical protein
LAGASASFQRSNSHRKLPRTAVCRRAGRSRSSRSCRFVAARHPAFLRQRSFASLTQQAKVCSFAPVVRSQDRVQCLIGSSESPRKANPLNPVVLPSASHAARHRGSRESQRAGEHEPWGVARRGRSQNLGDSPNYARSEQKQGGQQSQSLPEKKTRRPSHRERPETTHGRRGWSGTPFHAASRRPAATDECAAAIAPSGRKEDVTRGGAARKRTSGPRRVRRPDIDSVDP